MPSRAALLRCRREEAEGPSETQRGGGFLLLPSISPAAATCGSPLARRGQYGRLRRGNPKEVKGGGFREPNASGTLCGFPTASGRSPRHRRRGPARQRIQRSVQSRPSTYLFASDTASSWQSVTCVLSLKPACARLCSFSQSVLERHGTA